MKRFTIIALVLLALVVIGIGAFVLFQFLANNDRAEETVLGPVFETQEFTVNVSSSTSRYIKAKFALELSAEKVRDELQKKLPMLEDTIIMVLSKQTLEVLSKVEGKEALKESLLKEINAFLDKGQVTKIYFKNLIFS